MFLNCGDDPFSKVKSENVVEASTEIMHPQSTL